MGVDNAVTVNILSFGFKMQGTDWCWFYFWCAHPAKPHWKIELRNQTGLDDDVKAFLMTTAEVDDMANDIIAF